MKTITIYDGDATLSYLDTAEVKEQLFNKMLEFFKQHEIYSGEGVCQSDEVIIDAPNLLGDIADEIFKFEVTHLS